MLLYPVIVYLKETLFPVTRVRATFSLLEPGSGY